MKKSNLFGLLLGLLITGASYAGGFSGGIVSPLPITMGGTNSTTAAGARTALGVAASGANSDINSLSGLTTPLPVNEGGTGGTVFYNPVLLAPVATTSGTSVSITGIPSWARKIYFRLTNVGTNGTASKLIQVGAGSTTTSGYASGSSAMGATGAASNHYTNAFGIYSQFAADRLSGAVVISLENATSNTWCESGTMDAGTGAGGTNIAATTGGCVSLAGALDRVVFTTNNGTDAFVSGEISVRYEY